MYTYVWNHIVSRERDRLVSSYISPSAPIADQRGSIVWEKRNERYNKITRMMHACDCIIRRRALLYKYTGTGCCKNSIVLWNGVFRMTSRIKMVLHGTYDACIKSVRVQYNTRSRAWRWRKYRRTAVCMESIERNLLYDVIRHGRLVRKKRESCR